MGNKTISPLEQVLLPQRKVLSFLTGKVMKVADYRADPKVVKKCLIRELNKR